MKRAIQCDEAGCKRALRVQITAVAPIYAEEKTSALLERQGALLDAVEAFLKNWSWDIGAVDTGTATMKSGFMFTVETL